MLWDFIWFRFCRTFWEQNTIHLWRPWMNSYRGTINFKIPLLPIGFVTIKPKQPVSFNLFPKTFGNISLETLFISWLTEVIIWREIEFVRFSFAVSDGSFNGNAQTIPKTERTFSIDKFHIINSKSFSKNLKRPFTFITLWAQTKNPQKLAADAVSFNQTKRTDHNSVIVAISSLTSVCW